MQNRLLADKKVFWLLLALFIIVSALQDLPRMLTSHNLNLDVATTIVITIINIAAMFCVRHVLIYFNFSFFGNILIILSTVIAANSLDWVAYGFLRQIFGNKVSWLLIFEWSVTIGVQEAWFLFSWAALYYSFMQNAERQHQALALARANTLAHQAQLNMLRFQLNPHFLFNTLNSLSALILKKRNVEAESVLMNLSRFLRFTLDTSAKQMVSLREEINAQKHYLEIERVRFGDRLQITFDIKDGLDNACVPSLILQPLVENCIKHAIAKMKTEGLIRISAKTESGKLILTVEDNGPGYSDPMSLIDVTSNGVGVGNTAERLSLLYGRHGTLKLENIETDGFRSIVSIPLIFESTPHENASG